jgi:hypothetical protein
MIGKQVHLILQGREGLKALVNADGCPSWLKERLGRNHENLHGFTLVRDYHGLCGRSPARGNWVGRFVDSDLKTDSRSLPCQSDAKL